MLKIIHRRQGGFTLIEGLILFMVFFLIGVVGIGLVYCTICKGNFWYTETGVLKAIQADHPAVTKVIKSERKIWKLSEFTVQEGDSRKTYYLNTNVLWNYTVSEKEKR